MKTKKRTIQIAVFIILIFCAGAALYFYLGPTATRDAPQESAPSEKDPPEDKAERPPDLIQKPVEKPEIKNMKAKADELIRKIDRKLKEAGIDPAELAGPDKEEREKRAAEMEELKQRLRELREESSNKETSEQP